MPWLSQTKVIEYGGLGMAPHRGIGFVGTEITVSKSGERFSKKNKRIK